MRPAGTIAEHYQLGNKRSGQARPVLLQVSRPTGCAVSDRESLCPTDPSGTQRARGPFVPKPSPCPATLLRRPPDLGAIVRQRPPAYPRGWWDRHSVGHSVSPPVLQPGGRFTDRRRQRPDLRERKLVGGIGHALGMIKLLSTAPGHMAACSSASVAALSPKLGRRVAGRIRWWLSGWVAVLRCCTAA